MLAGGVVKNIESDQLVSLVPAAIPENEAQARPLTALTPPQQIEVARKVAAKTAKPTAKDFKEAADEKTGRKPKGAKSTKDENDEPTRIQSYDPREHKQESVKSAAKTDNSDLEKLMEIVDQAQTQARKAKDCNDVVKMLGDVAKLITRKLNGGRVC